MTTNSIAVCFDDSKEFQLALQLAREQIEAEEGISLTMEVDGVDKEVIIDVKTVSYDVTTREIILGFTNYEVVEDD
jgi:hypothetical protein